MGTLILFILISVAITVFQAAAQNNKQQRSSTANTQTNKPKIQPAVRTAGKTGSVAKTADQQNATRVITTKLEEKECWGQEFVSAEGVQTEALDKVPIPAQKIEPEAPKTLGILGDISADELQRSIIMSEVLGKPKALRR